MQLIASASHNTVHYKCIHRHHRIVFIIDYWHTVWKHEQTSGNVCVGNVCESPAPADWAEPSEVRATAPRHGGFASLDRGQHSGAREIVGVTVRLWVHWTRICSMNAHVVVTSPWNSCNNQGHQTWQCGKTCKVVECMCGGGGERKLCTCAGGSECVCVGGVSVSVPAWVYVWACMWHVCVCR